MCPTGVTSLIKVKFQTRRNASVQKWKVGVRAEKAGKEQKEEEVGATPMWQKPPPLFSPSPASSSCPTQAHAGLQGSSAALQPLSQHGGPTRDRLPEGQSALPLRSWKSIVPQLCDRFLSASGVEIIPLVLPNIIYSCLIFSLHLKAARLK